MVFFTEFQRIKYYQNLISFFEAKKKPLVVVNNIGHKFIINNPKFINYFNLKPRHTPPFFIKLLSKFDNLFYDFFGITIFTKINVFFLKKNFNTYLKCCLNIFSNYISLRYALITSDRSIKDQPAIYVCKRQSLEVIIIPSAIYGNTESIKEYRKLYNVKPKFIFIKPSNVFGLLTTHNSRSYYPIHLIKLYHKLNILSSNPFEVGYGYSNYIGFSNKLELTKHNSNDLKKIIFPEVNIFKISDLKNKPKNKILISMPQWWEHNLLDRNSHFKHINLLLNKVRSLFFNEEIYVSLHPKNNKDDYQEIINTHQLILTDSIENTLSESKILFSTFSTINLWASQLNCSSIVYDPIGLQTGVFKGLSSIITVSNIKKINIDHINKVTSVDFTKERQKLCISTNINLIPGINVN